MSIRRHDLGTSVCSLSYDFDARTGTLTMPPDCCADMAGAIALFSRIDARVQRIVTVAGLRRDTVYVHDGNEWDARRTA